MYFTHVMSRFWQGEVRTESESEMVARCPPCRTGSWVGVPETGTQGEEEKRQAEASSWAPKMCGIFHLKWQGSPFV